MSALPPEFSVPMILSDLCGRLEAMCYQWGAGDLGGAVRIIEQLAQESPRLEATRCQLWHALEGDNRFLDKQDL